MTTSETSRDFPSSKARDSVRFLVAKGLPYSTRLWIALALFAIAGGLQMATLNPQAGVAFLIASVLLVVVKGYDSRIRLKTFDIDPAWKLVPVEKVQELENLRKRAKRWDRDAFDASNPLGCWLLILLNALVIAVAFAMGALVDEVRVTAIILIDGLIILWVFWLTGMRFMLKQPNLAIRVRTVLDLYARFLELQREGEAFQPALKLARGKDGGAIPVDIRFSVAFPSPPEGFLGLQAQINLNIVQGTSYPYFYCVLAARPGFGLADHRDKMPLRDKVLCEYQKTQDAEVLVLRQRTTKKSGYHTDGKACERILVTALEGARIICGAAT